MINPKLHARFEMLKKTAYPEGYNIIENKKILQKIQDIKLPAYTDEEIIELREHTEKITENTNILEQYKKLTENINILMGIYEDTHTEIEKKTQQIKNYIQQFTLLNEQIQQEKNLKEPSYKLKKTAEILNTQIRTLIGRYKYLNSEKDKPTINKAPEI